jgi:hypothetical protein
MIDDLIKNVTVGEVGGMVVKGFGYLHGYIKPGLGEEVSLIK